MHNRRTQSNSEYRNLAIELLEELPSNPRRRFNPESLKELAESFKSQGILQPLVVRTKQGNNDENKYEVIAGARRLRAAQLAELKTVPVRVVALSDSDAILAQVTENLQREDIHPLEEAFGFRSLLNLNDRRSSPKCIVLSHFLKAHTFMLRWYAEYLRDRLLVSYSRLRNRDALWAIKRTTIKLSLLEAGRKELPAFLIRAWILRWNMPPILAINMHDQLSKGGISNRGWDVHVFDTTRKGRVERSGRRIVCM